LISRNPSLTLSEYLPTFFSTHYQGDSDTVRRTYRNAISRLMQFLGHEPRIDELDHGLFELLIEYCKAEGLKRATWKSNVARLRTVWRAAFKDGLTLLEPPEIHSWDSGLPPHKPELKVRQPIVVEVAPMILRPGEKPAAPGDYLPYYTVERGLNAGSSRQLRHRLNQFERILGRAAEWADFNEGTVNHVLATLLASGLNPSTVRGVRSGILALWNAAYEGRILDHQPGRIRKIKIPAMRPQCWTMEQLTILSGAIEKLGGRMKNAPNLTRRRFWKAFVLTGYYSGLRLGDLMRLEWTNFRDNELSVVMGKTGDLLCCRLPDDCMEALKHVHAQRRKKVFGDILNQSNLQQFFRRILRAAGLPGSVKWLRRTGASHVEAAFPGAAKGFLGHRTHGLAYKHYVDPTIVQQQKPQPPSLEGGKDGAA
jgi:site-specific recombinase XerD